jgi:DNA-binding MltR family transcriptional regulator
MSPKQKARSRLKKLAKQIPDDATLLHRLLTWQTSGYDAADYAIAVVGAAYVEQALKIAILSRLRPELEDAEVDALFDGDQSGPLSTFLARTKLAYAMNIFGPITRKNLEHMRAIRNAFAHAATTLRFDDREISELCSEIELPDVAKFEGLPNQESSRARYVEAVWHISSALHIQLNNHLRPESPLIESLMVMFGLSKLP